jgi:hypothetical protein
MGLLDDGQEYLRRSGRNIGGLFDWLAGGASAGAEPTMALMRGDALDEPFLPTADSGGRIGAIASAVTNHAVPGTMPKGSLGTYGGIGSKTANKQLLGKAKAALRRGEDAEAVRQRTGWFQDPTGDWKYEISDHQAELRTADDGTLSLHHPELRRAYPDMVENLKIETLPATDDLGREHSTWGMYSHDDNTARINERLLKPTFNKPPAYDPVGVLMHELQHGVQRREGHSPGTAPWSDAITHLENTEYWPKRADLGDAIEKVRDERNFWFNKPENRNKSVADFDRQFPDWRERHDAAIKAWRDHPDIHDWRMDRYYSALGEVEARDTQNRLTLTPEQRRAAPPYRGEGIPQDQMWDMRDVLGRMPRKAADTPFQGLLTPEQKGMALSLLGLPFLPSDTQ